MPDDNAITQEHQSSSYYVRMMLFFYLGATLLALVVMALSLVFVHVSVQLIVRATIGAVSGGIGLGSLFAYLAGDSPDAPPYVRRIAMGGLVLFVVSELALRFT